MATLKILNTTDLKNGRFLIICDIIDKGIISIGDFISFQNRDKTINIQIIEMEIVNNSSNKGTYTKLEISSIEKEKIKDIDLIGAKIKTSKPIRGVDIQLAANFGVGVKWWAGFVLLALMALLTWLFITIMK